MGTGPSWGEGSIVNMQVLSLTPLQTVFAFPAREAGAKAEGREGSLGIKDCVPVSQNPQGDLYLGRPENTGRTVSDLSGWWHRQRPQRGTAAPSQAPCRIACSYDAEQTPYLTKESLLGEP